MVVKRLTMILLLVSGLQLSLAMGMEPSYAHIASEWYPQYWWSEEKSDGVQWRFETEAPTGEIWRQRIKDAALEWNGLSGNMQFDFQASQPDYGAYDAHLCPPTPEKNGIHYGPVDMYDAETILCTYFEAGQYAHNRLWSFQIKFDSTVDWYAYDAGPVPSGKNDLESGAVHEFGHATGRGAHEGNTTSATNGDGSGHFFDSGSYCNQTEVEHHTMCQSWVGGRIWDRSLNEHDRDAFNSQYSS